MGFVCHYQHRVCNLVDERVGFIQFLASMNAVATNGFWGSLYRLGKLIEVTEPGNK